MRDYVADMMATTGTELSKDSVLYKVRTARALAIAASCIQDTFSRRAASRREDSESLFSPYGDMS